MESELSEFKSMLLRSLKKKKEKSISLSLRMGEIWIVDKEKIKDVGASRGS